MDDDVAMTSVCSHQVNGQVKPQTVSLLIYREPNALLVGLFNGELTGSPGDVEALGSAALVTDKLDQHLVALRLERHPRVVDVRTSMMAAPETA